MSSSTGAANEDQCDLDAALGEIAGQLNLLNARLVEIAQRVLESGDWSDYGMKSPAQFLAWRLGLSPDRAKHVIRVAERRDLFPTIIGAFELGELSLEQVVEVVKAPAWADPKLLDIASISTVTKLRRAIRSKKFDGEPAPPEIDETDDTDDPSAHRKADESTQPADRLSFVVTDDGRWRINGEVGIDDGRRIEAALTERRDALFAGGNESITWPEALVDCCARSLGAVESDTRRDHYRTWIHLEVASGETTTTDGWRLPDSIEHHLLCDGHVQPVGA